MFLFSGVAIFLASVALEVNSELYPNLLLTYQRRFKVRGRLGVIVNKEKSEDLAMNSGLYPRLLSTCQRRVRVTWVNKENNLNISIGNGYISGGDVFYFIHSCWVIKGKNSIDIQNRWVNATKDLITFQLKRLIHRGYRSLGV